MRLGIPFLHAVLLSLLSHCNASKLLIVFPIPSKSHAILGEGYIKYLAGAGHEITYITSMPLKSPPNGVRQIDISENKKFLPIDNAFDTRTLMNSEVDLQQVKALLEIFMDFSNKTLHLDVMQEFLLDSNERFDVVIVEWLYTELYAGLAALFDCPLIWSSSMEPHSMILSLIDEYPNPSYTLEHLTRYRGFGFWQRVQQLWMLLNHRFYKWRFTSLENDIFKSIYEKSFNKRGKLIPHYHDVIYNASLVLGNSHVSSGEPINLPQSYKPIGGYHLNKNPEPLPEELQNILDEAKDGVIYFSLGSLLKSTRLPDNFKIEILNIFRDLNQTVIWKFEEMLPDMPKNVHILSWAPQTSILAHPNCVLFITHGGLLSMMETLHYGVPVIGLPHFADQFMNTDNAVSKGFGKRVDLGREGSQKLNLAIREMIGNPSYRQRAMEYSFIQRHRPATPEAELVHWVEHVIKTRGAKHLRSPALGVPWYQKYYVDLAAVILLLSVIALRLYEQGRNIFKRDLKEKML